MFAISNAGDVKLVVQGGRRYRAFPFGEASLVSSYKGRREKGEKQLENVCLPPKQPFPGTNVVKLFTSVIDECP